MVLNNPQIPLDSRSAVTVFKSISILRPNPREELTATDLENSLAQALWKSFDSLRGEAASRLGIDEVDLLFADARVMGIKIDGHQVINPEGFPGREIDLALCITIVRRDKLPKENGIVFEEGAVRAYLGAQDNNLTDAIYIESGDDTTVVFHVSPRETSYVSEFRWGKKNLIGVFAAELGADSEVGNALYLKYADGGASPAVTKKLDDVFRSSFGTFVNGLAMVLRNSIDPRISGSGRRTVSRGSTLERLPAIYLKSFPLPEAVWSKSFDLGGYKAKLIRASETDPNDLFRGPSEIYSELNRLAKRRIKWLMPENNNEEDLRK